MDYNHITNFLEKFKKLIYKKEEIKEVVIGVIKEELSHQVESQAIKIKSGFRPRIRLKMEESVSNTAIGRKWQLNCHSEIISPKAISGIATIKVGMRLESNLGVFKADRMGFI